MGKVPQKPAGGSVLAEQMYGIIQDPPPDRKPDQAYFQRLEKLTAKKWLKSSQ